MLCFHTKDVLFLNGLGRAYHYAFTKIVELWESRLIECLAPCIIDRRLVYEPLHTAIIATDAMIPHEV